MKHVDSKTSLAELNPEDPTCFICLELENDLGEPVVPSSMLRTCGCVFVVHPHCWNTWMKDKTDWDCPICRKKSLSLGLVPVPPLPTVAPPQPIFSWRLVVVAVCCMTVLSTAMVVSLVLDRRV
jgi:hypothetical protein